MARSFGFHSAVLKAELANPEGMFTKWRISLPLLAPSPPWPFLRNASPPSSLDCSRGVGDGVDCSRGRTGSLCGLQQTGLCGHQQWGVWGSCAGVCFARGRPSTSWQPRASHWEVLPGASAYPLYLVTSPGLSLEKHLTTLFIFLFKHN